MITQALLDFLLVVFFLLRYRENLRRSALAGHFVGRVHAYRACCALSAVHNLMHGVNDALPVALVVKDDLVDALGKGLRSPATQGVFGRGHDVRSEALAARCDGGRCMRKLQRRGEHIALTDGGDDSLPGEPALVRAFPKSRAFPLPGGNQPGRLATNIDAG